MDRHWRLGCADDAGAGHYQAAGENAQGFGQRRCHDHVARGGWKRRGRGGSARQLRVGQRRVAGRCTRRGPVDPWLGTTRSACHRLQGTTRNMTTSPLFLACCGRDGLEGHVRYPHDDGRWRPMFPAHGGVGGEPLRVSWDAPLVVNAPRADDEVKWVS